MPDFANLSAGHLIGAGVGVGFWAYFMLLCVARTRAAGVDYKEPPFWLYTGAFKFLRFTSLLVAAFLGLALAPEAFPDDPVTSHGIPFVLALLDATIIGGLIFLIHVVYRRFKAQSEQVVIEPLSRGELMARILVGAAILGVVAGIPILLSSFLGVAGGDIADLLLGGGKNAQGADLGAALAMICWFVFFFVGPRIVEDRLEDQDLPEVWANSTGVVLWRWGWAGVTAMAATGLLGGVLGHPLPVSLGLAIGLGGPVLFLVFWVMPMRNIGMKAAEGDHVANEFLPLVRFAGIFGWMGYSGRTRGRKGRYKPDEAKQVCPTCLRPINDIAAYTNFKFDACPHCKSFIPPIFTVLDYVKAQSARVVPIVEGSLDVSGKAKRSRNEDETRLVQDLLRAIVAMTIADRGTDLHFLVEGEKFLVRCRTDGHLYNMLEFNKIMGRPLISSLKVQANLDIAERRKPQDGRYSCELGDKRVDVRVNTSPVADGEMATLRLLYRHDSVASIQNLGIGRRDLNTLTKLIQNRSGLIVVTGPTGSGKSTTLYNSLEVIATGERNIITLEDPVEYELKGVTQMQVNAAKGFTFDTGLRSILRQDPDVIMVGEIRDAETAKMGIDAAATGHLVFTTLHATDSTGTIGRLDDLGVDVTRYATVLVLALAQRLIRVICPQCATDQIMTREQFEAEGLPGFPEDRVVLRRGLGCPHCHETGYRGREGVYEFFVPDDELRSMIIAKTPTLALRQRARQLGMRTMLEDGLAKVLIGRTTLDEALRSAR